ncbi:MAG TPA: VWA domain-containing protein [Nitrospirota bacterium]|nr:VWA domain-containing protein [Nitrospirota bacterium]
MKNELNVRCIMSKDALPVTGSEQAVYALIDIKPKSGIISGAMAANFALVLDRSGSMDGEKMANMKEAVGYVLDHLSDHDLVSITIFDDQVETLASNQVAQNRDRIKANVESVIARGGTQISDGLRAGLKEAMKGYARERVNRILLLTDGRTWDDEDASLTLADEAGKQSIAITSIGIGDDWNEKLLLQIAERSRGNSHWIQNPISILDAFRQEVDGMQTVAAANLKVTIHMHPGVQPIKIYTTVPMIADVTHKAVKNGIVAADLGTLDGARGQTILLEARVPAEKAGRFRLGEVEVSYDIPTESFKAQKSRTDLFVTFTEDAATATKVNAEVMNLVEKVSAFKLQTRALTEAEAGNIAAATQKLQAAATVFLNLGEDELAETAEKEILGLKKTGSLSSMGTKKLEYGTRKLTQTMK